MAKTQREEERERMNAQVGNHLDMNCPHCKKTQKHIFCRESYGLAIGGVRWFWRCTGGHKVVVCEQ
jgi:hypothetical protein